jgi:hypothetical protein
MSLSACILSLLACGGDSTSPVDVTPISRVGTYTLRTVDGKPLPYAYPNTPGYELIAESLTLNGDNTFSARSDQRVTQAGQVTTGSVTNAGTYTITGLVLQLSFSTGQVVLQDFTGPNEITGHCCGSTWVYMR